MVAASASLAALSRLKREARVRPSCLAARSLWYWQRRKVAAPALCECRLAR
jgi:hypothetical protein